MGVQDDGTQLVQVDFEVFGHVQGELIKSDYFTILIVLNSIISSKCLLIFLY